MIALADLAVAVPDWHSCRIVGGNMVTVHIALANADVDHRPTADADLVAPVRVLGDKAFADRLNELGYERIDGSRLSRTTAYGVAAIDLLAPAPASRARHNRRAGDFRVDEFPGFQYALHEPGVHVNVVAVPLQGGSGEPFGLAVPTLRAAIVVKALAGRERDREDLRRLLTAAAASATVLPPPPYDNLDVGRAAAYLHGPFLSGASQDTRALVDSVVPRPPERPAFANL